MSVNILQLCGIVIIIIAFVRYNCVYTDICGKTDRARFAEGERGKSCPLFRSDWYTARLRERRATAEKAKAPSQKKILLSFFYYLAAAFV